MKKYPNFNREVRAVRLTNKIMQDVYDIMEHRIYAGREITNVYRREGGALTGNTVINGVRKRVLFDKERRTWNLSVVSQ